MRQPVVGFANRHGEARPFWNPPSTSLDEYSRSQPAELYSTYLEALHYITLHYITLHYITLHYINLNYFGSVLLRSGEESVTLLDDYEGEYGEVLQEEVFTQEKGSSAEGKQSPSECA